MTVKTNFEMLDELYEEMTFANIGFINENETVKIANTLEMVGRSRIDCENLKQFNVLFFEHKITPIYDKIDKLTSGGHIENRQEFDELMDKRDRYRRAHDAIDLVVEHWLYEMKD